MKLLFGPLTWRGAFGAASLAAAVGLLLQGCSSPVPPAAMSGPATAPKMMPGELQGKTSLARTPKAYRHDAAQHLYARTSQKIYKGRLPPMLYAVGVLDVDIDRQGQVQGVHWMRAPRHAPEVMAEIEQIVRAAAPYPAPQHLGKVTYTDVWLWDKSGRFQLDTLTEGQD